MKRPKKIRFFILFLIVVCMFSLAFLPAIVLAQLNAGDNLIGSHGGQYEPLHAADTIAVSNSIVSLPSTGVMVWLLLLVGTGMVATASFILIGANRRGH